MAAVSHVLVIGAGAAGAAAAILLAEAGVAVRIAELKTEIGTLGSGITLQGNALRVLRRLGVWDRVSTAGYAFDTLGIRAPDPHGTLVAELTDARTGGPDLPATLGMYRPELARILTERATEVGAELSLGCTVTALEQDTDGVLARFADGSTGRYDLVIGADGVRSWTRGEIGIADGAEPTGMGIWRAVTARPATVTRTDLYYGGPLLIAGYCPTGADSLYAYLVEPAQDRSALSPQQRLDVVRELARAYHGPWDEIRAGLTDAARINYTWFEAHVLPLPWHRGRVVLLGDAAHTCPPTVAQGAAMAFEDAAVLAELLGTHDELTDKLLTAFAERRYDRVKSVVDASVQLGRWQLEHDPAADVPGLMAGVSRLVTEPA